MTSDVSIQQMKKFCRWQGMMSFQVWLFSFQFKKPSSNPDFCPGSSQASLTNTSLFTAYSESMVIKDLLCPQQGLSAESVWIKSPNKGIIKIWTGHSALTSQLSPLQIGIISKSYFTSTRSKGFIIDLRLSRCLKSLPVCGSNLKVKSQLDLNGKDLKTHTL